ncbi:MAG: arylsulfatase A-like enzyme [Saprospiraceae bacterium]|jgi:arylsulfatase A-like enzyme
MSIRKKRLLQIGGILIAILLLFGIWFSQNWYKIPGMIKEWEEPVLENQAINWKEGPTSRSSDKPNVIVILVDDLGFNEISTYGGGMANGQFKTPHIDQMAAEGVLCTNGYSAHAVCAPSRASLLTGRYSTRAGFEFTPTAPSMMKFISRISNEKLHPPIYHTELEGIGPDVEDMGLPLSEITIAELLKPQGYHNIHIGKWHLGNSIKFNPTNQGFDESLGLHSNSLFLPIDDPNVVNARLPFDPIDKFLWGNMAHAANWNGGHRFHPDGHTTDYLTNEAVKAIEANKNQPFFMYMAYWAVHTPLQANKEDYDKLSYIEDHAERVQAAMVMTVDRGVGKIRQALKDNGIDENTIIVFTSDNGAPGYIGMPEVNSPFRGWKISLFEGGIHIPYIVSWPGKIPAGQTYDGRVSNLDIFSTFAAIAGADLPTDRNLDGINIPPYLTDSIEGSPNRPLFYKDGNYSCVINDNWKLQMDGVQGKKWLFNLANDPTEQQNLVNANNEKLKELTTLLETHLSEQNTSLWPALLESPIYIDKTLDQEKTEDDEFVYWAN